MEKIDEVNFSKDNKLSDDVAFILQQVKQYKIFLKKSPITHIIKDLIKFGGDENAKILIQLYINQ